MIEIGTPVCFTSDKGEVRLGTVFQLWDSLDNTWQILWEDGNVSALNYRDHRWQRCLNGIVTNYYPDAIKVFDL